jgi:hypothetical protein
MACFGTVFAQAMTVPFSIIRRGENKPEPFRGGYANWLMENK